MAGFWSNLFGKKEPQNSGEKQEGSFFLDPDSAKTVGDIDYMRKAATVRRTFPKAKTGGGGEIILEVSSSEVRVAGEPATNANSETAISQVPKTEPNRSQDSSMNMFRNMAKDLRKD